jgi:hypothetical protein
VSGGFGVLYAAESRDLTQSDGRVTEVAPGWSCRGTLWENRGTKRRLPIPNRTTTFRLAFLAEPIRICLIGPMQLNGGPVAGVRIRDAYPPSQNWMGRQRPPLQKPPIGPHPSGAFSCLNPSYRTPLPLGGGAGEGGAFGSARRKSRIVLANESSRSRGHALPLKGEGRYTSTSISANTNTPMDTNPFRVKNARLTRLRSFGFTNDCS